jgi:hypothetical protein
MTILAQFDGENTDFLANIPTVNLSSGGPGPDVRRTGGADDKTVNIIRLEQTEVLLSAWVHWISEQREWKNFLTLTFRDEITQEAALAKYYRLVRLLNRRLFGSHYTRIVGHSYFSYVIGIERQTRGVLHLHCLVDRPIDYSFIHKVWNEWAGFVWIEKVGTADRDVIYYISKYISKGGELLPYFADLRTSNRVPNSLPIWWSASGSPVRLRSERRTGKG